MTARFFAHGKKPLAVVATDESQSPFAKAQVSRGYPLDDEEQRQLAELLQRVHGPAGDLASTTPEVESEGTAEKSG
jgi:hypothetical protein